MAKGRMFLVENGFVVIRDDGGASVAFNSIEEFEKYVPEIDLTGKNYIDYEPQRGVFIDDSDSKIGLSDAPVAEYEQVIDDLATIRANKADPYYQVSLEEAKKIKISSIKSEANLRINAIIPEGQKQANSLALGLELVEKKTDGSITQDEVDVLNDLRGKWDLIKSIRSASDVIEATVDGSQDIELVKAYDEQNATEWPE